MQISLSPVLLSLLDACFNIVMTHTGVDFILEKYKHILKIVGSIKIETWSICSNIVASIRQVNHWIEKILYN